MSPSQLKSNVVSLDCHISQYATVCQQLQAEVRSPPGEHGWEAELPGTVGWRAGEQEAGASGCGRALCQGEGAAPASFAHLDSEELAVWVPGGQSEGEASNV